MDYHMNEPLWRNPFEFVVHSNWDSLFSSRPHSFFLFFFGVPKSTQSEDSSLLETQIRSSIKMIWQRCSRKRMCPTISKPKENEPLFLFTTVNLRGNHKNIINKIVSASLVGRKLFRCLFKFHPSKSVFYCEKNRRKRRRHKNSLRCLPVQHLRTSFIFIVSILYTVLL